MEKLEWSAPEYEDKNRSSDWFWAVGIIFITASLTSIIYGNYFFGILLILSGLLIGFFAIKKPDMISYELNDVGLEINNNLYPYEAIKSFWVQIEEPDTGNKAILFVKSQRFFMPVITIPIEDSMADYIHSAFELKNVLEERMTEPPTHKIMEGLGL